MFKKTIIGIGAAAVLAAGSLGISATAASASGIYVGGPDFYVGVGHHPHRGHRVCEPVYKKVRWIDKWGHKHSRVKYVGQKCWWQPYHNWQHGW